MSCGEEEDCLDYKTQNDFTTDFEKELKEDEYEDDWTGAQRIAIGFCIIFGIGAAIYIIIISIIILIYKIRKNWRNK